MANTVTLRVTAPGAKEAAQDLADLKTSVDDLNTTTGDTVDTAGDIAPAFSDAADGVDMSGATSELQDLASNADDAGASAEGMGQDFSDAQDEIDDLDISGAFSGANKRALKGAADVLDHLAGTDLKPVAQGLVQISSIAKPFEDTISSSLGGVMDKIGTKLAPVSAAAGSVIGTAMAEAQAVAATGAQAVSNLGARIAAMQVPLAASGTTVGTAVGGAMSAGMFAGLGALGAAPAFLPEILSKVFGTDPETQLLRNFGASAAQTYATGFSDEIQATYAQTAQAAFDKALSEGKTREQAAQEGKNAGDAYVAGFFNSVDEDMPTLASHIASEHADNFKSAGATTGESFTGGVADGIRDSESVVGNAMDDLIYVMTHPQAIAADKAQVYGALMSSELAAGLQSGNPLVRQQAQQTYEILTGQWEKLTSEAWAAGNKAATKFSNGYDSGLHVKGTKYYGHTNVTEGGRASGGPVAGHGIYEVNERGDPEVLESGGKNYLLMGRQGGMVKPMGGPQAGGWGAMPPIHLTVLLSMRQFATQGNHHAVIQEGASAF